MRDKTDEVPRSAEIGQCIVPADTDRAAGRQRDPADGRNQRGFACAVGAKQGQDLALFNLEVDGFQGLKTARVCFAQVLDRNNG